VPLQHRERATGISSCDFDEKAGAKQVERIAAAVRTGLDQQGAAFIEHTYGSHTISFAQ
jgi:hypothetical protein